jgi:acetyl-CoA carboxylase carboxyltransferase component
VKTQEEGIEKLRRLIEFDPRQRLYIERRPTVEPRFGVDELMRNIPVDTYSPISVRDIIKCIADDSYFSEYKEQYGPGRGDSIICGKMWMKGIPVGVIASNKNGVIFTQAAQKAAEFIVRCSNDKTPLLFIQGAPGYMVGKCEEWDGIGKYGSNMVRTVACSKVPKIQWVIGPDHGAANYGMCGRAYRPNFIFHTLRARTTVMSGNTAGFILESLERKNTAARGETIDEEKMAAFRQKMRDRYDTDGHPFTTGSVLLHDGLITWAECRDRIARGFELALRQPIPESKFGNVKF